MKIGLIALSLFFSFLAAASPVLDRILEELSLAGKGIIIMDLDETLIDSHVRMYNAYAAATREFCGDPEQTILAPVSDACEKLHGLSIADFYRARNGYSAYDLMARLKVPVTEFVGRLTQSMLGHYLSGKWMDTDGPMPGAVTYVRELKRRGAEVFFVTARYGDTQAEGTRQQIEKLGLGLEEERLVMRQLSQDSLAFKAAAVAKIKESSIQRNIPVLALFENEPENLNAWKKAFPGATAVFIKGNILVDVELTPEAQVIENYR